jgi:AcrR family transcriptional regulator
MDTREMLVRVAEKLMLRDGYSTVRVDDIVRQAGLSKGSFYHFFDSKESLGLAALEHYKADRVKSRKGDNVSYPDFMDTELGYMGGFNLSPFPTSTNPA